ncbi:histidine phosphatase family protein [Varibaculum vaginae]|uniref:histidine phosphatase family protein n=1 Tax=Varibaculum vaginae TaxID=2364797 RepID=UPI000F092A91|nr:histidine phosphatase family protein [Varibaculum vaginae]
MKLVLMRHGQTSANITGALDTAEPGAPLNQEGIRQARAAVKTWDKLGLPAPQLIVTSNLIRTQQTARPLEERFALTRIESADANEVQAGKLEMATDMASVEKYVRTIGAWMQGDLQLKMDGGESGAQTLARFNRVVSAAADQVGTDGCAVIVAHGAIIRYWSYMNTPEVTFALAATKPVSNASLSVFEGEPGNFAAKIWSSRPVGEWEVDENITELRPSKALLDKLLGTPHEKVN